MKISIIALFSGFGIYDDIIPPPPILFLLIEICYSVYVLIKYTKYRYHIMIALMKSK